jgi:hypothetical protein
MIKEVKNNAIDISISMELLSLTFTDDAKTAVVEL